MTKHGVHADNIERARMQRYCSPEIEKDYVAGTALSKAGTAYNTCKHSPGHSMKLGEVHMVATILKTRAIWRWMLLICGWLAWLILVYYMPSDPNFQWNVLNILLALLSPYLWSRALTISLRSEFSAEDETREPPTATKRAVMEYRVYFLSGLITWGIVVFNIPPVLDYPWKILFQVILVATPYFWLTGLGLYHESIIRSRHETISSRNRIASQIITIILLVAIIGSGLVWGHFVFDVIRPPTPLNVLGLLAPFFWMWSVYYSWQQ